MHYKHIFKLLKGKNIITILHLIILLIWPHVINLSEQRILCMVQSYLMNLKFDPFLTPKKLYKITISI